MRILFTSPILEHPAAGGPQLRVENSIKALARVCELDVVSGSLRISGDAGQPAREFYQGFCDEFTVLPSVMRQQSANRYLRKARQILEKFTQSELRADAAFIIDHVTRRNIDIIWFGFGNISYPLIKIIKESRPELKVICDTDSVWSRFLLRELPYAKGRKKRKILKAGRYKEKEERAWVNLCEVTTAVSEVDADYYRSLSAHSDRVHLFSNVIDPSTYEDIPAPAADLRNPSIYLAGTFWVDSPMENAARWMLKEVLPLVRQHVANVQFIIVGNGSDEILSDVQDPSIVITGKLPSVLTYLCHTDVALVPLKFESGTRFKIMEAGACKIPIVSTTLGAEGIPVIDGEHLLIADDPEPFAEAIVRLISDRELVNRLTQNCNKLVSEYYSVEFLAEEAKSILEYLDHG